MKGGENEIQSDTGNAFMEKEQSSSKGNSIYRFDLMKTEKLRKDFLPVANIYVGPVMLQRLLRIRCLSLV